MSLLIHLQEIVTVQVNLHGISWYEKDGTQDLDVSTWAGISEDI